MQSLKSDRFFFSFLASIYFLLIIFVHKNWLLDFGPLVSGDWAYFYKDSLLQWYPLHSIWMNYESLGRPMTQINFTILFSVYSILANFGLNFEIISRLLFFFPIAISTPIFAYIFFNKVTNNPIASLLGSAVYTMNSYVLVINGGHLHLSVAYTLVPLVLFFFYDNSFRKLLIGTIILFLMSLYEIRIAPLVFCFASLFLIVKNASTLNEFFSIFIRLSILFAVFVLLNFFWIITLINLQSSAVFGQVFKQSPLGWVSILDAITFHHPFWSILEGVTDFKFQTTNLIFFIIPILVMLPLLFKRFLQKDIIFIYLTLIVAIFFLAQQNPPLGNLYIYLYHKFPFMAAFRESTKFFIFLSISYSFIISVFFKYILESEYNSIRLNITKYILCLTSFIFFVLPAFPFINGIFIKTYSRTVMPDTYTNMEVFFNNNKEGNRILWLSSTPKFAVSSIYMPNISGLQLSGQILDTLKMKSTDKFFYLQQNYTKWLLQKFSIRYLVSVSEIDDPIYKHYANSSASTYDNLLLKLVGDDAQIATGTNFKSNVLQLEDTSEYFRPITNLYNIPKNYNLNNYYSFISKTNRDFDFVVAQDNIQANITNVESIFSDPSKFSIDKNFIIQKLINNSGDYKLVVNGHLPQSQFFIRDYYYFYSPKYKLENIILDPSFEERFWNDKVQDCRNYDKNPIIKMSTSTLASSGNYSLQLESVRHNACTNQKISVKPGATYFFYFDYQAENTDKTTYTMKFNDKDRTEIRDDLAVSNHKWNSYSKIISVPDTATSTNLSVYSFAKEDGTVSINRYDNFKLIEIPDISNYYYFVSRQKNEFLKPKSITYDFINPTKKLVHIKGASTNFFLGMSESYHPQWQAQFNNKEVNGLFNSWIPFVKPVKIGDEYHYKLNDFLNAWYIDVDRYCVLESQCKQNSDGSYDIEMVIEFFPQRWFYFGLVISGITLFGCLWYLGYGWVKELKNKLKFKYEKND